MASNNTSSEVKLPSTAAIQCTARGMASAGASSDWNNLFDQANVALTNEQDDAFERLIEQRILDVSLELKTPQLDEMKQRIAWKFAEDHRMLPPEDATMFAIANQKAAQISIREMLQMVHLFPDVAYAAIEDLIPIIPINLREPDFIYRTLLSLLSPEQFNVLHAIYCVGQ